MICSYCGAKPPEPERGHEMGRYWGVPCIVCDHCFNSITESQLLERLKERYFTQTQIQQKPTVAPIPVEPVNKTEPKIQSAENVVVPTQKPIDAKPHKKQKRYKNRDRSKECPVCGLRIWIPIFDAHVDRCTWAAKIRKEMIELNTLSSERERTITIRQMPADEYDVQQAASTGRFAGYSTCASYKYHCLANRSYWNGYRA